MRIRDPNLKLQKIYVCAISNRVVDPDRFVSDPNPDPPFKEVSAPTPTPDPDPVSDPATLVSASTEFHFCR